MQSRCSFFFVSLFVNVEELILDYVPWFNYDIYG